MSLVSHDTNDTTTQITNDNNYAEITGELVGDWIIDHETNEEKFYSNTVRIKRSSGVCDDIVVVCSEYLITETDVGVHIIGQFRSYNYVDDKNINHLRLFIFVKEIEVIDDEVYSNDIYLEGVICSPVSLRETPKGKKIADVMLAINRAYGKADYIPCIAWNINALKMNTKKVGDIVFIHGRIQSREYTKYGENRIAYEVSIISINN